MEEDANQAERKYNEVKTFQIKNKQARKIEKMMERRKKEEKRKLATDSDASNNDKRMY